MNIDGHDIGPLAMNVIEAATRVYEQTGKKPTCAIVSTEDYPWLTGEITIYGYKVRAFGHCPRGRVMVDIEVGP